MSSTKKHGQYYFGMKMHTGVDSKSGVIHSLEITTAKVPDIKVMPFSITWGRGSCIWG